MKWQKEKPDFKDECLVICANKIKEIWHYNLFEIRLLESENESSYYYMGWLEDGEEVGDLADMEAQLYLVIPLLPEKKINEPFEK